MGVGGWRGYYHVFLVVITSFSRQCIKVCFRQSDPQHREIIVEFQWKAEIGFIKALVGSAVM